MRARTSILAPVAFFLSIALTGRSADAPASSDSASAAPSTEATIDSVGQQIRALEKMDPKLQVNDKLGIDLPGQDALLAPSLDSANTAIQSANGRDPRQVRKELQKQQKKQANWLLDAMEKTERTTPDGKAIMPKDDLDSKTAAGHSVIDDSADENLDLVSMMAKEETKKQEKESAKRQIEKPKIEVKNPLDDFMKNWVSGGDLQLLQGAGVVGGSSSSSASSASAGPSLPASVAPSTGVNIDTPSASPVSVDTNPFLAALEPLKTDSISSAGPAQSSAPGAITALTPADTSAPASGPTYSPVPEPPKEQRRDDQRYAPSSNDQQKYFPQLNPF